MRLKRTEGRLGGRLPTPSRHTSSVLVADRAFDRDQRVLEPLAAAANAAVTPTTATRVEARRLDRPLCRARRPIENFVDKAKRFCAIATRHDRTPRAFVAAGHLVGGVIWLG